MIKPGTILNCINTEEPDNTFTMTYLSAYIDVCPEEVDEAGLECRYYVKAMDTDGNVFDLSIWLHTDGRMSIPNGWWVKTADTQNNLLLYLMSPKNENNRVRKLIEWLEPGLNELTPLTLDLPVLNWELSQGQ